MPKYQEHGERELKVLDLSREFVLTTLRLLKSENIIPKSYRWMGLNKISEMVIDIDINLNKANNIKVTNKLEYESRHHFQTLAYASLTTTGEMLDTYFRIFDMKVKTLNNWLNKKAELQRYITAWRKSDEARYQDIG